MKPLIYEAGALIGKTVVVTVVVALGFMLCGWLGLPRWALGLGLIPAGYVFCWLAGEPFPSLGRWLPILLGVTLLTYVFSTFFPAVPEFGRTAVFLGFVMLAAKTSNHVHGTRTREER
jgi:hypothetical protein